MIRDETQTVIATITCLVTFSVGHPDSHGRYEVRASGSKRQNEHGFSLCLTRSIKQILLVTALNLVCESEYRGRLKHSHIVFGMS